MSANTDLGSKGYGPNTSHMYTNGYPPLDQSEPEPTDSESCKEEEDDD